MEEWFWTLSLSCATILAVAYSYIKWKLSYWKRKGLEFKPSNPFQTNVTNIVMEAYEELKAKGQKHGGLYLFLSPIYMPIDLDIVKAMMQNDSDHFADRTGMANEEVDPLTGNLFDLAGDKWKQLRMKLSPTFTSGKIKMMFQTMVDTTPGLIRYINEYAETQEPAEAKQLFLRYSTDVIGSCAFGLDCNNLTNSQSDEFKDFSEIVTADITKKLLLTSLFPRKIIRKFKLTSGILEKFFFNLVEDSISYRESNNVYREDFMHLLLQLRNRGGVFDDKKVFVKKNAESECHLSKNEMAAQCYIFFTAGFDTSATTMSGALLALGCNQDVQEKLRQEIRKNLEENGGKLTYESIMGMEYLDKIVNETLRLHGPVKFLVRRCTKDYNVSDTKFVLKKGDQAFLPLANIHKDPDYYPDPETFDPERFSRENKAKRPGFTFLPFGDGPRVCIGMKFGLLQVKVGLTAILTNFKVTLNKKTKFPLRYDSLGVTVEGGIWVNFEKLK